MRLSTNARVCGHVLWISVRFREPQAWPNVKPRSVRNATARKGALPAFTHSVSGRHIMAFSRKFQAFYDLAERIPAAQPQESDPAARSGWSSFVRDLVFPVFVRTPVH